jgi:1,2-dihydroxy-3-keto-5-methylthiopentene dioxygenase
VSKLAFYTQFNFQRPYKVAENAHEFSEDLAKLGIRVEQWPTLAHLPSADILEEDVFKIYGNEINRVKSELGYNQVDLATMKPNDAFAISVRGRYLSEHIHEEDEVRFFLSGKVLIYLNIKQKVHILECTRGDFVIIPAGVKHWMDIGPKPDFSVIRWFNSKKAFINNFTESFAAEATPRWETIYSEAHFNINK